jgi:hypothetical protein
MKIFILTLIVIFNLVSCHRYGNFKLKKEVLKENQIYFDDKLDFNSVYVGTFFDTRKNINLHRYMRFFPNGRMYIEYWFTEIEINEQEHYNKINNTKDFRKGQKTYYVFLDSNIIKFESFENSEFGNWFHYAIISGDSISIFKSETQSIIKKTYEFDKNNLFYYIKKEIDLKPVEVDW